MGKYFQSLDPVCCDKMFLHLSVEAYVPYFASLLEASQIGLKYIYISIHGSEKLVSSSEARYRSLSYLEKRADRCLFEPVGRIRPPGPFAKKPCNYVIVKSHRLESSLTEMCC
jgi:hypothetical protein